MFGLTSPANPLYFRQEFVTGLTPAQALEAGRTSTDDMKVHGYAAAGVAFDEPEMDSSREVPEIPGGLRRDRHSASDGCRETRRG